ncbi:PROTEIN YABBY 6-RELATED [Salix purpurea]|uniref:PROTEIN YABBY 6-RELATED n=1 Tax=Salix purpurea TaxID=77065 RepID=A0A9Q0Z1X9_SALPP|nr:PROTEIN YABBY 6-RELATED [Salix purpurea]
MNLEEKLIDADVPSPDHHLSYVRCNFCNTVLAVRIPCKRMLDTVTVKCGHCNNLSFLSTRPPSLGHCFDIDHHQLSFQGVSGNEKLLFKETQGFCSDFGKGEYASSSTSSEPLVPKVPFVVKPPEKKHRLPSSYNRFMKEEIQRIKAANPEIPHREAFSTAAKNWARYLPNSARCWIWRQQELMQESRGRCAKEI